MYTLNLELTESCNLRCSYCCEKVNEKMKYTSIDMMTAMQGIDLAFNEIEKLKENEIYVTFYGGEPLIEFNKMKKICNYVTRKAKENNLKTKFSIITNGTLFNKEIIEYMIKNNFDLTLSLDGTPEMHDINRKDIANKGSYEKIYSNMNYLRDYTQQTDKLVKINMVIAKNTYKNFHNNVRYIYDLGFRYINSGMDLYEYWEEEELEILEKELNKVIELWFNKIHEKDMFVWEQLDTVIKRIMTKKREHYYCGAGVKAIYINTKGLIFPCNQCTKEDACIGDVYNGINKEKSILFHNYNRNLKNECLKCSIKDKCAIPDCLMNNLQFTGDIYQVPIMRCKSSKLYYKIVNELIANERLTIKIKKSDRIESIKNSIIDF